VQTAKKQLKEESNFDPTSLLTAWEEIRSFIMKSYAVPPRCPRQIHSLQEALSGGDVVKAHRQAHSLKGASANVGAVRLQKVALEMEMVCERVIERSVKNSPFNQNRI